MKKILIYGTFMLMSVFTFANSTTSTNRVSVNKLATSSQLENVNDFSTVGYAIVDEKVTYKADECTVSMTAEISVGIGKVSVTVSYTSSSCESARQKCILGLERAARDLRAAVADIF